MTESPNTVRPSAWFEFLKARKAMIAEFWDEGKSIEDIVRLLSLDPTQTQLIIMSIEGFNSASLNQNARRDSND